MNFVSGLLERHPSSRPRVPELPQEQPTEGAEVEQGGPDLARQRRARAEEGAGANREGTSPATDGRRRRRLQETHRSEEGQAVGVPAVTDGRVHHPADGHGKAAQEGSEEKGQRNPKETETGLSGSCKVLVIFVAVEQV